jgi:hypothetical protein
MLLPCISELTSNCFCCNLVKTLRNAKDEKNMKEKRSSQKEIVKSKSMPPSNIRIS